MIQHIQFSIWAEPFFFINLMALWHQSKRSRPTPVHSTCTQLQRPKLCTCTLKNVPRFDTLHLLASSLDRPWPTSSTSSTPFPFQYWCHLITLRHLLSIGSSPNPASCSSLANTCAPPCLVLVGCSWVLCWVTFLPMILTTSVSWGLRIRPTLLWVLASLLSNSFFSAFSALNLMHYSVPFWWCFAKLELVLSICAGICHHPVVVLSCLLWLGIVWI